MTRGIETRVQNVARGRVVQPGPAQTQAGFVGLPAVIGGVGRSLPGIGRAAGTVISTVGGFIAGRASKTGNGACEVGFHPNKAKNRVTGQERGTYCVRNRRMNVGNARAARRSVRRLKGARKLLRDIEKMMPTKTSRRRAPAGHSQQLTHT